MRRIGASSVAEAIAELEDLALDTLTDVSLADFPTAHAEAPWVGHSGRVTLRLPKMLHGQLDRLADEQGVSLNQLITTLCRRPQRRLLAGLEFGACASLERQRVGRDDYVLRGVMDDWSMVIWASYEEACFFL